MWGKRNILQRIKGPSIKYVTLFLANFYPLPLSHFVTHPGTIPRKYVTHLGTHPQIFSRPSTKIPDKSPLYKLSLNCSRSFICSCKFGSAIVEKRGENLKMFRKC